MICYFCLAHGSGGINCNNNSIAFTFHQLGSLLQELVSNTDNGQCTNNTIPTNDIERKIDQLDVKVNQLTVKVNQLTVKVDQLVNEHHTVDNYSPSPLLHSCQEIKSYWTNATSDYYLIADNNGQPRHVYCNMEQLCNSEGGWMRVAYLNMSDSTEDCPTGFNLYNYNGIRACGRPTTSPKGHCQSVKFPSYSISYSQVCGRVIGYQYGSPDAIYPPRSQSNNINGAYVDGVSLTYGNPRKHIWTFIAGLQENFYYDDKKYDCPCSPSSPVIPPAFIGNDYFCESGCPGHVQLKVFYTDPLWDGKQCGILDKPCCTKSGLPWFHKTLTADTTDYIELRICGDEDVNNEDVPVSFYELYVK